ncbi:MAG: metallophosphoesterase family protein [Vibrio sp.]|uniref:metallophosphoesterase family protein n=1 Tax=Vibrio TaxID=662 RepID=UPI0023F7B53C|nr:metallophosphoesterase [Vibrio sp. VCS]
MLSFKKVSLSIAITAALLSGCNNDSKDTYFNDSIKIGIVTDTHLYDASMGADIDGEFFQSAISSDRKAFLQSQELLDNAIQEMINNDIKVILVPGDLTKDGERINHNKVRESLQYAKDKGIKVYVVPGNHDMNNPYGFKESLTQTPTAKGAVYLEGNEHGIDPGTMAPHMTNATGEPLFMENWDVFYRDFGFSEAVSRDPNSFSFVAEPIDGVQILVIDAITSSIKDVQKHWQSDNSDYGKTGGSLLTPERAKTLEWIQNRAREAKAQGKILLAMSHAGVVEHFPSKSALIPGYVIDGEKTSFHDNIDVTPYTEEFTNIYTGEQSQSIYTSTSEYVSKILAQSGVNIVFTGHFHANDIAKRQYEDGSWIYDIQTGASVSYPAPYRSVLVDIKNKTITTDVDNTTVMESVPDADLIGLVDGLSENIFAALGVDVDGPLLEILDNSLTKKPVAQTMLDVYKREDMCSDLSTEECQKQFEEEVLSGSNLSWDDLYDTTLSQLIGAVLKAHYHGDEANSVQIDHKMRFVLNWAREYGQKHNISKQVFADEVSNINELALSYEWNPSKDFSNLLGDKTLAPIYGLLGTVGEGIIYDPVPDIHIQIDLTNGKFESLN